MKREELAMIGLPNSRRAPRGARGLKHDGGDTSKWRLKSRPARGAWIETLERKQQAMRQRVAPRAGRVD